MRKRTKVLLSTSNLGVTTVLALTGLAGLALTFCPGVGGAVAVVGPPAGATFAGWAANFAAVACPNAVALENLSMRARCSARNVPSETTRPESSLTVVLSGRL